MEELDVYVVPDGASGHVGGFYVTHAQNPTTVTRSDARTGYYDPVVERPNLTLLTGHQVTKLLTNNTSGTPQVTGVEVCYSTVPPLGLTSSRILVCHLILSSPQHCRCQSGGHCICWCHSYASDPPAFWYR